MTDRKFEMHGPRIRNTDTSETGVLITTSVRSPAGMEFPGFNDVGEYRVPVRLDDGGLAFFLPEHLKPEPTAENRSTLDLVTDTLVMMRGIMIPLEQVYMKLQLVRDELRKKAKNVK